MEPFVDVIHGGCPSDRVEQSECEADRRDSKTFSEEYQRMAQGPDDPHAQEKESKEKADLKPAAMHGQPTLGTQASRQANQGSLHVQFLIEPKEREGRRNKTPGRSSSDENGWRRDRPPRVGNGHRHRDDIEPHRDPRECRRILALFPKPSHREDRNWMNAPDQALFVCERKWAVKLSSLKNPSLDWIQ